MWLSTHLRPTLLPLEPMPLPGSTSRLGQEEGESDDPWGERQTESTTGKWDAGLFRFLNTEYINERLERRTSTGRLNNTHKLRVRMVWSPPTDRRD